MRSDGGDRAAAGLVSSTTYDVYCYTESIFHEYNRMTDAAVAATQITVTVEATWPYITEVRVETADDGTSAGAEIVANLDEPVRHAAAGRAACRGWKWP